MTQFITRVVFRAFDRDLEISFYDAEIHMTYTYRRRVKIICPTAIVKSIRWYEATLTNSEIIHADHPTSPTPQSIRTPKQ